MTRLQVYDPFTGTGASETRAARRLRPSSPRRRRGALTRVKARAPLRPGRLRGEEPAPGLTALASGA